MVNDKVAEADPRMEKAYNFLLDEFKSLRTGRANPALVEAVSVTYYEQTMPLKQLANISATDAKSLTISPWDPNAAESIEKAIREDSKLDLNPTRDGKTIHINIPPLTAERREQLVKQLNEKVEASHVALRNIRHEVLQEIKKMQQAKQVSDDDYRWAEAELNTKIENFRKRIDEAVEKK